MEALEFFFFSSLEIIYFCSGLDALAQLQSKTLPKILSKHFQQSWSVFLRNSHGWHQLAAWLEGLAVWDSALCFSHFSFPICCTCAPQGSHKGGCHSQGECHSQGQFILVSHSWATVGINRVREEGRNITLPLNRPTCSPPSASPKSLVSNHKLSESRSHTYTEFAYPRLSDQLTAASARLLILSCSCGPRRICQEEFSQACRLRPVSCWRAVGESSSRQRWSSYSIISSLLITISPEKQMFEQ